MRGLFFLGVAFAFAACPTLFVLFLSTMIPPVVASFGSIAFPAIFVIGTTVLLILFVVLLAVGAYSITPLVKKLRTADVWVSRIGAIVFILVGIDETRSVLYWFL